MTYDPDNKALFAEHSAGRWRLVGEELNSNVTSKATQEVEIVLRRGESMLGIAEPKSPGQLPPMGDFVLPHDPRPTPLDMPKRRR